MVAKQIKTSTSVETCSGIYFDVINPRHEDVRINDIAHALGNQCRYGGHCKDFYSVAEHSVLVSRLVRHVYEGTPAEIELALLHDASEAYLVDIPTPVKGELNNYRTIEDNLMNEILEALGMSYTFDSMPECIHKADVHMLSQEVYDMIPSKGAEWSSFEPRRPKRFFMRFRPRNLRPRQARRFFLREYHRIRWEFDHEENSRLEYWKNNIAFQLGKVLPI